MFKAVTGLDLEKYDTETRDLYRRREISEVDVAILHSITRKSRNLIPIVVNKENSIIAGWEKSSSQYWWKLILAFGVFCKSMFESN